MGQFIESLNLMNSSNSRELTKNGFPLCVGNSRPAEELEGGGKKSQPRRKAPSSEAALSGIALPTWSWSRYSSSQRCYSGACAPVRRSLRDWSSSSSSSKSFLSPLDALLNTCFFFLFDRFMYSFEMDLSCEFINGFLWSGGEQREREFL